MDLGDLRASSKILIHPSLRQRFADANPDQVFAIEIQNYQEIVEAFGLEAAYDAFATLVARVQDALGPAGLTSPEGEARLGVILWGVPLHASEDFQHGASCWFEALVKDIVLEPVSTAKGPVHLNATVTDFERSDDPRGNGVRATDREIAEAIFVDEMRRSYRSDMAVLSPVLAALGGFRAVDQVALAGDVLDVDVCWQPVVEAGSPNGPVFYEASFALINADCRPAPGEQAVAAAERIGLVHLLDQYLVSRAVDELLQARGAVTILVSVCAQSFSDRSFWSGIIDRLKNGGGVACDLIVEVRGAAIPGTVRGMSETLAMLKRRGCRISFGNLGLGSTSLRDLAAFAPDFVTIDRHFLSAGARAQFGTAPLSHLVGLARALGAEVIVDGVDCINSASIAHETGAELQKGAWCGGRRISRPWVTRLKFDGLQHTSGRAMP